MCNIFVFMRVLNDIRHLLLMVMLSEELFWTLGYLLTVSHEVYFLVLYYRGYPSADSFFLWLLPTWCSSYWYCRDCRFCRYWCCCGWCRCCSDQFLSHFQCFYCRASCFLFPIFPECFPCFHVSHFLFRFHLAFSCNIFVLPSLPASSSSPLCFPLPTFASTTTLNLSLISFKNIYGNFFYILNGYSKLFLLRQFFVRTCDLISCISLALDIFSLVSSHSMRTFELSLPPFTATFVCHGQFRIDCRFRFHRSVIDNSYSCIPV